MNASNPPARKFADRLKIKTDIMEIVTPKANASSGLTSPDGIGLLLVLFIMASISLSYHWLIAPEAPAPAAMASNEMKVRIGCKSPGAR